MLALISSTSGGRSVGIVRLRTTGHGVCFSLFCQQVLVLDLFVVAVKCVTGILFYLAESEKINLLKIFSKILERISHFGGAQLETRPDTKLSSTNK
jgi:hypothetical protein